MGKNLVFENSNGALKEQYIHYPLILSVADKRILLNRLKPDSWEFKEVFGLVKKEKEANLVFYSSQAPFVLETIHKIADAFIKDVAFKIDPLLRELVKNAEKENATLIAKRAQLIDQNELHAPLDLMGKILKEKYYLNQKSLPLLYEYSEISIALHIYIKDNLLFFDIENFGMIDPSIQSMIMKKIQLGCDLADFDLRQEFEMRPFIEITDKIRAFFLMEYPEDKFDSLWKKTFEEDFSLYWESTPYFLLLSAGTHTSFYPYFATAYQQLRITAKKEENPDELHFSAGMGYIQCAFVIEANRNFYGTYGKVFTPETREKKTIARFMIGMPYLEVEI